ncbi:MAG TPA: sigma-54 dependent transcriptional regulator, partial [Syntrophobacteraceae bacterium]|nr:sigma-54 dependent transcriptional regulator [Syntrophobacteraceae bacterium]
LRALEVLQEGFFDLIITDVMMPGLSGRELFNRVNDLYPDIPVIIMSAFGTTEEAIHIVKQGAFHYFEKPLFDKLDLFWTTLREALAKREMGKELDKLNGERALQARGSVAIIGNSPAIEKVKKQISEVAELPVTVLIYGETGTGKELVAQAIHELSPRRDKPFFEINCARFAPGVLESELFGHEKGSFTGAVNRRKGYLELADQGTILLDEIGEASFPFQAKLLRVLETKSFMRVGGTSKITSDFRIIAATNRNLEQRVVSGRFRDDLLYRLNLYTIVVPPLRDRKDDIPLIAEFYLKKLSRAYGRRISQISGGAMVALLEYNWPGNVRELVNVLERAVITCRNSAITTRHLPFAENLDECSKISDLSLKDAERCFISLALKRTQNNKTRAAELLGISRKTLHEKLRSYGFDESHESSDGGPAPDDSPVKCGRMG